MNPIDKVLSELGIQIAAFWDSPNELFSYASSQEDIDSFLPKLQDYLEKLSDPAMNQFWSSHLSALQTQARACLAEEVLELWTDEIERSLKSDASSTKTLFVLLTPISLAFIAHNLLHGREIDRSLRFTASDLQRLSPEELYHIIQTTAARNRMEDAAYPCERIHPEVEALFTIIQQEGLPENAMHRSIADYLAEECLQNYFEQHMMDYMESEDDIGRLRAFTERLVRVSLYVIASLEGKF
jgi:hypothetical protein